MSKVETVGRFGYGSPVGWWAFVDESMRQRHDKSGIYFLAAAILDPSMAEDLRLAARGLAHGRRRFHWRYEEPSDRRKAVGMIGGLDMLHLVVVGTGLDNARQERGRRQCMERLLWELSGAGVSHVWLDARRPQQNRRDLQVVDRLRIRQMLAADLQVDFAYSQEEPLAWLPDIVAGAVSAAIGDGDHQYLMPLAAVMFDMITIEL
jgi:hypothetical protein